MLYKSTGNAEHFGVLLNILGRGKGKSRALNSFLSEEGAIVNTDWYTYLSTWALAYLNV